MNRSLLLCAIFFVSFGASCTKPEVVSAPENSNVTSANRETVTPVPTDQKTPSREANSEPPPNPKDVVTFDGTNYIKKSGWKTPSKINAYINQSYDQGDIERPSETGKVVMSTSIHYIYRSPWYYSQKFYFEGKGLELMKGNLKSGYFLETSVNRRVFMYSIFGERVVPPPASNNDPHEDPFGYRIMDNDGDGVFETLLGERDEIIVPDWVLRRK